MNATFMDDLRRRMHALTHPTGTDPEVLTHARRARAYLATYATPMVAAAERGDARARAQLDGFITTLEVAAAGKGKE